jgi:hypothetical protein
MYDTETVAQVLEDIRSHPSILTDRQERFLDACEYEFEDGHQLGEHKIALLYEILDELDERAGLARPTTSEDEWWKDDPRDDDDDDFEWDEGDFWR